MENVQNNMFYLSYSSIILKRKNIYLSYSMCGFDHDFISNFLK